jgi:hypothetical protein
MKDKRDISLAINRLIKKTNNFEYFKLQFTNPKTEVEYNYTKTKGTRCSDVEIEIFNLEKGIFFHCVYEMEVLWLNEIENTVSYAKSVQLINHIIKHMEVQK